MEGNNILSSVLAEKLTPLIEDAFSEFKGEVKFSIEVEHETVCDRDFMSVDVMCELNGGGYIKLSYDNDGENKINSEWNGDIDGYLNGSLSVNDDEGVWLDSKWNVQLSDALELWADGARDRIIKILAHNNVFDFVKENTAQYSDLTFYYGKRPEVKDVKIEVKYNDVKMVVKWDLASECYASVDVISSAYIKVGRVKVWGSDEEAGFSGVLREYNKLTGV